VIGRPQSPAAERIVSAGVEDHDVEPPAGTVRRVHLVEHPVHVEHLEFRVRLPRHVRVDGNEIVRAAELDAVAGIVEQRDVGALHLCPEALHGAIEAGLVQVDLRTAAGQREAKPAQGVGDEPGVARRASQRRNAGVFRIAHDEGDTLVRAGRGKGACKRQPRNGNDLKKFHQRLPRNAAVNNSRARRVG
jgi:hypothetical protein